MTGSIDFSKDLRHLAVVTNVKRLLTDAEILLAQGSPGSALAMAILAFEESGKGERLSIGWDKPKGKGSPSWHVFRQQVAAFALFASLFQKYGLSLPKLDREVEEYFEERRTGAKNLDDLLHEPIPKSIFDWFLETGTPGYACLSRDDRLLLSVELRWVRKVFFTAATGKIELERQGAFYVDTEEKQVTSDPSDVTQTRAAYWITVAMRSLSILRDGAFAEPYGQLSEFLERLPRPLPSLEDLERQIKELKFEHD